MLHFLKKKYETIPNAPFQCINMITKLENKELLAMESTFDSLFMIATQKFNDPQNIAHFYTIKTISLWLACCKHKKSDLLSTNDFIDQLASPNVSFNDAMGSNIKGTRRTMRKLCSVPLRRRRKLACIMFPLSRML